MGVNHTWIDSFLEGRINFRRPLASADLFDRKICNKCGLEKMSIRRNTFYHGRRVYETFYFKTDENGNVIEGGPQCKRVPYGCGEREVVYLTDDDLNIDF